MKAIRSSNERKKILKQKTLTYRQGSEWSAEDWTGLASQVESQV